MARKTIQKQFLSFQLKNSILSFYDRQKIKNVEKCIGNKQLQLDA